MTAIIHKTADTSSLDRVFRQHKWFVGATHTVREALEYFAKSGDFYLDQKAVRSKKTEVSSLFDVMQYENVIRYAGKDLSTYRVNEEEKRYFLERLAYWKAEKERRYQEWLQAPVRIEKAIRIFLAGHGCYNVKGAEIQLEYAKRDLDEERVKFWEKQLALTQQTKVLIDELIVAHKETIHTNQDFENLKSLVHQALLPFPNYE